MAAVMVVAAAMDMAVAIDMAAARLQQSFDISALPEDAMRQIRDIATNVRFNSVVETGVRGFIARAK